jgi:localization factor PodJL
MADSEGGAEVAEPVAPRMAAMNPAPTRFQPATPEPETVAAAMGPVPLEAGPIALREAADSGNAKAIFEIGNRYAEGRGVGSDMAKAAGWYERSAELDYAPAQYRLGNFYEKGTGVERDINVAIDWYQRAAKQGNASAMHNLAVLYAMGADGVTDNDRAARWFIEAAELGVKDSQYNLGILAAKGAGMPQSLEESYKWFALVAKSGDRDAIAKRDEVAKALRPEQLEKAKAAAELWKARAVVPEVNVAEIPDEWTEGNSQTASVDVTKAVRNIQGILNKNGYDAGPADGMMGARTKSAIQAFQADNGMTADGEVSEALIKALLEKN